MDYEKWRGGWTELPRYDCPTCKRGLLRQLGDIRVVETRYSEREGEEEGWEPDWMTRRFVMLLQCDDLKCGEVVTVAGNQKVQMFEDYEEQRQEYVNYHYPFSVYPAPHVFSVSNNLSEDCQEQLVKAFELMWVDSGASANRIRIFVERLMDQFNMPTVGTSKKGKPYELKLADRINEMEKLHPGHKDSFDALRWVGNEGSHSGNAGRKNVLTCFEVLERVLEDLVDGKKARLHEWQQKIVATKGKA
jgi:hypothetical protein